MQPAFQQVNDEVFFSFCMALDTPVSLSCYLLYKYGEFRQLVEKDINPADYTSAYDFHKDYAAISYFSKADFLKTGINLSEVALSAFTLAEDSCRDINRRFQYLSFGTCSDFDAALFAAQRKIAKILGPFDINAVMEQCNWGPGANVGLLRRHSQPDNKMCVLPITTTHSALPYIKVWLEHDPHWFCALTGIFPEGPYSVLPSCFSLCEWNKVVLVPKSAKTHRVIAIEPMANSFLQKGVGAYIRKRLKYHGVNLDDQSINQVLAARAWSENLATLDLKSASDTISIEVCKALLPIDWFNYLDALRCRFGKLPDGRVIRYNKFSSMGNAFTFELESLIFYALAQAVSESPVSVYGDDIIVSQRDAEKVISILKFCGFTTNLKKSHLHGAFFESCGKHYFQGIDVTPIFQKKAITDLSECFRAHNRLFRLITRLGLSRKPLRVLRRWARTLRRDIDRFEIHIDGFTDDAFLVDHVPPSSFRDIHGLWCFQTLRPVSRKRRRKDAGALANYLRCSLSRIEPLDSSELSDFVAISATKRLKARRLWVHSV